MRPALRARTTRHTAGQGMHQVGHGCAQLGRLLYAAVTGGDDDDDGVSITYNVMVEAEINAARS